VGASPRVADLLARGDRLSAIKAYRQEHQVGLREGKEEIERLERVLRHLPSA
jgi:ribosomal protein L7/L12